MRASNIPSGATRTSEVALLWKEIKSGTSPSTTTFELPSQSCVRVRAVKALTVTIEGVLAATMINTEIMLFNVGEGSPNDTKRTVTFTVNDDCFIQVGQEVGMKLVDNN